jgi:thiol-disulfide isomerase/thioredoxin
MLFASILLAAAAVNSAASFPGRNDPSDRLGISAPPLALAQWINSEPLEIARLRGRVVLVRWWTDTCPFCVASAPSLIEFDENYRDKGLVTIGVFHPKPSGDRSVARMRRAADRLGFRFPVALDADWTALRRWWLDYHDSWTSVSFLIDRSGVIRYVHPGGEFHQGGGGTHWADHSSCNREHREIEESILRLLAEPIPAAP